jgi:uncharacterized OsmC-like protein
MEVSVQHLGGVQFEAIARGHRIICDQPEDNQGFDEGMTPPELMLSSLATCAAFYAAQYLKTRGLPGAGLQVRVTAEKARQPARIGSFRIEVQVPELEDDRHREGLLRAVHSCLIHNTLLHPPAIEIKVDRLEAMAV